MRDSRRCAVGAGAVPVAAAALPGDGAAAGTGCSSATATAFHRSRPVDARPPAWLGPGLPAAASAPGTGAAPAGADAGTRGSLGPAAPAPAAAASGASNGGSTSTATLLGGAPSCGTLGWATGDVGARPVPALPRSDDWRGTRGSVAGEWARAAGAGTGALATAVAALSMSEAPTVGMPREYTRMKGRVWRWPMYAMTITATEKLAWCSAGVGSEGGGVGEESGREVMAAERTAVELEANWRAHTRGRAARQALVPAGRGCQS